MSELQSQQYVSGGGPGFPTFLDLRTSHNLLLRRQRETELIHLRDDVQGFIGRARATGAILDAESHRDAAQALIDYWTTTLYRAEVDVEPIALEDFNPMLVPMLPDEACPYVGLEAFREADGDFFFGRRRLVQVLLDRIHVRKFVAVLGQSGSGKSSVVMGGLLPAMRRGEIDGSESWKLYPPIVPGSDPLRALAAFFVDGDVDAETTRFRGDPHHLAIRLDEAVVPGIVVIDQFEELFTLCDDPAAREALSANIAAVVQRPDNRHTIVVTMRSDYELYLPKLPLLQPLFEAGEVRITPLNAAELREAIERPASLVGLKFDEGLVDALVRDTLGEPAALPLLQFTLLKLWDERERNRLTMAAYRRLGGSRGALEKTADAVLSSLLYQDQQIAKRILLRIVRFSPGVELMRNRIREAELYRLGDNHEGITRVLDRLVQARLIRRTPGKTDGDTQIEVAHESLVRNWPTLVGWLEQGKANLATLRHYEKLATDWIGFNRESGFLDAAQIVEAKRWMSTAEAVEIGISSIVEELVEASSARLERLDLENKGWQRRRKRAITALVVLGFVAAITTVLFFRLQLRQSEALSKYRAQEAAYERHVSQTIRQKNEIIEAKNTALTVQSAALQEQSVALATALSEATDAQRRAESQRRIAEEQTRRAEQLMAEQTALLEDKDNALKAAETERLRAEGEAQKAADNLANFVAASGELRELLERELTNPGAAEDEATYLALAPAEQLKLADRTRPIHPGLSVGGYKDDGESFFVGSGSLGCFVQDAAGDRYLLGFRYVLGDDVGTPVLQPGPMDDGAAPVDQVAVLTRAGEDEFRSAAIAKLLPGIEIDPRTPIITNINQIADEDPQPGDTLRFVGRGSGAVEGHLLRIDFDEDLVTDFPVNPGNTGAPVLNDKGQVVGLVWGGYSDRTWVIPIKTLLREMDVRLASDDVPVELQTSAHR
ncbi:MAG TPA: hypothetical protein VE974_09585 [Thermoanaerobaculia bacterium]|nr:hypothetical protein [Thermoanaerobaculia bacterium]